MKKLLIPLAILALPHLAAAQLSTSISNAKDLALRQAGEPEGGPTTVYINGLPYNLNIPASPMVHIPKISGTLDISFNMKDLFPGLGLDSVVTAAGQNLGSTGSGIDWTLTDPSAIGQTFVLKVNGTSYNVKITSFSGEFQEYGILVKQPIYDVFDSVYRTVNIQTAWSGQPEPFPNRLVINGTTTVGATTNVPVQIGFQPLITGIGGMEPVNFVTGVTAANSAVPSGSTFTYKVTLHEPAAAGGVTVTLGGTPFSVPASVKFPAGATTETVTATAPVVEGPKPGYLTASLNGYECDVPMMDAPYLASIVCKTSPPIAGAPIQFYVYSNFPAPSGGINFTVHCDDPNFFFQYYPGSIQEGQTFDGFWIITPAPNNITTSTGVKYLDVSASYQGAVVRTQVALH